MHDDELGLRPLTARSVIVSMLLGTRPPALPTRVLVASADLFGVTESAARTALSRLVAAGELVVDDGRYSLVGELLTRQERQEVGRIGATPQPWSGEWLLVIIDGSPRAAAERSRRRTELARARLGEARDGVWVRPDNLGPLDLSAVPDAVIGRFEPSPPDESSLPGSSDGAAQRVPGSLPWEVSELWDLDSWQRSALGLKREVESLSPGLEAGDDSLLARGFVVAAAVLRLFQHDPLLPEELLTDGWLGDDLRSAYDRFDVAYRALLRSWFREQ